jgi:hypothetical protein
MAIAGKVGAVLKHDGDPIAFTDEATTPDATYTRYIITDSAKRYWNKNSPVTVKVNGVIQTSGFSIEYVGGVVVFDSALQPTDTVTVSGEYYNVTQVMGFKNWSLDPGREFEEATCFESGGWKEFVSVLTGASGSCEGFWVTDRSDWVGAEHIIVLYVDYQGASKARYEGYGFVKGKNLEVPVDSLVEESLDFEFNGPVYYREG